MIAIGHASLQPISRPYYVYRHVVYPGRRYSGQNVKRGAWRVSALCRLVAVLNWWADVVAVPTQRHVELVARLAHLVPGMFAGHRP